MNFKKLFLLITIIAFSAIANAQGRLAPLPKDNSVETGMMVMMVVVLLLAIILFIQILNLRLSLRSAMKSFDKKEAVEAAQPIEKRSTWWNLVYHTEAGTNQAMEGHTYDGIVEYNNNPPAWFNYLFYLTIAWGIGYLLYYHVFKVGDLPKEEYRKEMAEAKIITDKAQEQGIKLAELPPYSEAPKLATGKGIYLANCLACHGDKGQGLVGPNLTDKYWLHGGKYKQVFSTIFNGVPDKGMLSWKKTLKAEDIRLVASYVESLKGSNPPNAKAPQGVEETN